MIHRLSSVAFFSASLVLASNMVFACADRDAAITALENGDLTTAARLAETVAEDVYCGDDFRNWLNTSLARETFRVAMTSEDPAVQKDLYQKSLNYKPHWRTHVALANLANADEDHATEALELQLAINLLADETYTDAADRSEVEEVYERATQAMLLAETPVDIPRTRSGDIGGIFAVNIRGFTPEEVPVPIEFEFDSAEMTPLGRTNAEALFQYLASANLPEVVLEGHTDPDGTAEYNMDLSIKRAAAVQQHLSELGYMGTVVTVGKGETEVPPPPAGATEGSEDHHQLARRVVLVRG